MKNERNLTSRGPNRRLWRAASLLLLAAAVYANSLGNSFHYDDFHSIVDNPHIRSLANIPEFFADPATFSSQASPMYRPSSWFRTPSTTPWTATCPGDITSSTFCSTTLCILRVAQ